MRKIALFLFLFVPLLLSAQIKSSSLLWDISKTEVSVKGDRLEIELSFDFFNDKIYKGTSVVLQPFIQSGNDKILLRPIAIYYLDKNNKKPIVRKGSEYASGNKDEYFLSSGHIKNPVNIISSIDYPYNLDNFNICVEVIEYMKDSVNVGETRIIAFCSRASCPSFEPLLLLKKPNAMSSKRENTIDLYIKYKSNQENKVNEEFADNYTALSAFKNKVSNIVKDTNVVVSSIVVKSFSDFEGKSYQNTRLCDLRLKSLKTYLSKHKLFDKIKVSYLAKGEDWETVKDWFSNSFWNKDNSLKDYLFGKSSLDNKEKFITNNYPELYQSMRDNLFYRLNRFECNITYTVKPFSSLEAIFRAYRDNKEILSPLDFYSLSQRYDVLSNKWCDVFFYCADLWNEDYVSNYNACVVCLQKGSLNEAYKYLRRLPNNEETTYLNAVWQMFNGRTDLAYSTLLKVKSNERYIEDTINQIKSILDWENHYSQWSVKVYTMGQDL